MTIQSDKNNSTEILIKLSASGDENSFKLLIDKYSNYAFRIAYKILLNSDDAKDAAQDSFIKVWRNLYNYKKEIKFTTWLYKIVINLCFDKIKSNKRKKAIFEKIDDDYDKYFLANTDNLEKNVSEKDIVKLIEKIADRLPEKQKLVFELRDFQNLSLDEVSAVLNISVNSVKTNLFYARKTIAEKLRKLERLEAKDEMH